MINSVSLPCIQCPSQPVFHAYYEAARRCHPASSSQLSRLSTTDAHHSYPIENFAVVNRKRLI